MSSEQNNEHLSESSTGEFVPLAMLERWLRSIWLVVALTVAGGLAGWIIHQVRPPLYEARIGFTVSYDLTNMGAMTQFEQDHASGAVGELMYASDILQSVAQRAGEQGIPITPEELLALATKERQAQTWYIRVRHTDPATAAALANLWGEEVNAVLAQTFAEGVKAQELERYLVSLETCLQRSVVVEPVMQECSARSLPSLEQEMRTTGQALTAARLASRGILPSLAMDWSEKAVTPSRPALLGLGQFVLAGSLLGFLLAVTLVEGGLVGRWSERRRLG